MKNIVKIILILVLGAGLMSCKDKTTREIATNDETKEAKHFNSHLYSQTNETKNAVIHYSRNADGTLTEVERVVTNGKGTNGFKATTGETSAPDPLLSASSVILSEDNQMLFVANSGDNTVSIFKVAENGKLTLIDNKASGETNSLNSLSYNDQGGCPVCPSFFWPKSCESA